MSTYRESSELSGFNPSRSTDWIPVSPELASVVKEAI
jgi:thiamine biosynthesis lipoprotein ApbE